MRLFWKFFLSFWVALVLFSAASVLTASQFLERMRERQEATTPRQYMMGHVAEAQAAADRAGIDGLRSWARQVDRRQAVPILVLNPEGKDALAREVPTWILERHARRADRPPPSRDHSASRLRPVVRLPDGTQYRLVPDFQGVTLARVLRRPWVMAVPLLVARW
jgi:two-component system sensor histidine kinase CpxA